MIIWFILLAIGAYLLGSIPTAYLVARWRRGIDIRQYGSGNVGASNVATIVSRRWAVAVTIFDVAKGVLPVGLAKLLGLGAAQEVVTGIAAIIGHNWTPFLGFQGGRGIFTSLGVIAVLTPRLGLIALVVPYLFAPFHLLALGVTLILIALPVLSWGLAQPLGVREPVAITLGLVAIAFIALMRRFTAPRSPLSASVPTGELILYRLLFDRDIRDRETWVKQRRTEAGSSK